MYVYINYKKYVSFIIFSGLFMGKKDCSKTIKSKSLCCKIC